VLDNISALRQVSALQPINGDGASGSAYLFKPADAILMTPGNDNGTPMPRDEPLAENAPVGAMIDYYLKSNASGPVTIEILDPAGESVRKYSSEDKGPAVNPETLNIPAYWVRPYEPLSTAAGMHRWIWDLRPTPPPRPAGGGGGRGAVPMVLPGIYTVKLSVGGKTYTQSLVVKMDPRTK
jgi:hypothetical protein